MSAATVQELPDTKTPFDWKRALFLLGGNFGACNSAG